jgi:4-hydroxybenzoate polyprenyltransferase
VLGAALSLGHTAPPLKLGHRGFGEINRAFTLTTFPALLGWVSQGGAAADPLPWLISMPAFCALLGTRTLAGIPDRVADAAVGRKTYAVIFGPGGAVAVGVIALLCASLAGVLLWSDGIIPGWPGLVFFATIPHALALSGAVVVRARTGNLDRPLDGILLGALAFSLWFGLIPFVHFVGLAHG